MNGSSIANIAVQPGRIVIVGIEPLLEAFAEEAAEPAAAAARLCRRVGRVEVEDLRVHEVHRRLAHVSAFFEIQSFVAWSIAAPFSVISVVMPPLVTQLA